MSMLLRLTIAAIAVALLAACAPRPGETRAAETRAAESVATSTPSQPRATATLAPQFTPTTATQPPTARLSPPPVSPNSAYLGAWVNPAKTGNWVAQLPQFQADLGGKFPGIINFYVNFVDPVPTSNLQLIAAKGSVPLISWACKDVSAIAAGQYDQQITQYANGLKAFGQPVFVRWCWEMNEAHTQSDIGSAGPSGYVAAWKHIYTLFHQAGATNVALVWCPGGGNVEGMGPYFPGADYVDWIGIDDYLRQEKNVPSFIDLFKPWYSAYVKYNKPLIVVETGALPNDQAAYLDGIGKSVPTQFPALKAILYFDAPGPEGEWELTPAGLAAFARLLANPYFSFHQ